MEDDTEEHDRLSDSIAVTISDSEEGYDNYADLHTGETGELDKVVCTDLSEDEWEGAVIRHNLPLEGGLPLEREANDTTLPLFCFNVLPFVQKCNRTELEQSKLELCMHCIKYGTTEKEYLSTLSLARYNHDSIPRHLPTLFKYYKRLLKPLLTVHLHRCHIMNLRRARRSRSSKKSKKRNVGKEMEIGTLVSTKVPYTGILNIVSAWLSVPTLRSELEESNRLHILPFIKSKQTLIDKIKFMSDAFVDPPNLDVTACSSFALSPSFLQLLLCHWDDWRPHYERNNETPRPLGILFIHLIFYTDDWDRGKRKSSGNTSTNHCNYQISAAEFSQASRAKRNSLAVMVLLLCLSMCVKLSKARQNNLTRQKPGLCPRGHEHLIELFMKELHQLSKG